MQRWVREECSPEEGQGIPHLLQSCQGLVRGLSRRWAVAPRLWWRDTWRACTAGLAALQHAKANADWCRCSADLHGTTSSFRPCLLQI